VSGQAAEYHAAATTTVVTKPVIIRGKGKAFKCHRGPIIRKRSGSHFEKDDQICIQYKNKNRFECFRRCGFASKPMEEYIARKLVTEVDRRRTLRMGATMSGLATTATSKIGGKEWDNYTNTLGKAAGCCHYRCIIYYRSQQRIQEEEEYNTNSK
jgi:hypothetical protein